MTLQYALSKSYILTLVILLHDADVLFGFLAYQFPCHVALCFSYPTLDILCNVGDLLLDVAKSIHRLINFLPPHIVLELEREELLWERKGAS